MLKKYIYIVMIFCSFNSCAQKKVTLYSEQDKIAPRINIPMDADILLSRAADFFATNFKLATGKSIQIERSNSLNKNYNYISLSVNPTQKDNYCLYKKGKNINIQAISAEDLLFGIGHFFEQFTSFNYDKKTSTKAINFLDKYIEVPEQFSLCSSPSFEYREPYFSTNFNVDFRAWNRTNYLDISWGIWGHNLKKILKDYKLPESVYAEVDNKRVKSQFCFTSDSLFTYVNKQVKTIYDSDHGLNRFMILPNDNSLVCNCNTCKAVGNTKTDAAPAVFSFLNKLAKNHENMSFFTTAYITIKEVPKFSVEDNIGIFYSTINIQKGIPIEDSKYNEKFTNDITKWKDYVDNVYIWDYAVNFDNYFDIYPSLYVTQKNLQFYKELGVNGVFIHGSEYEYSTFQDLKTTIFSKLLWNVDIYLEKEINDYFHDKYPRKLANALSNYYTFIDKNFLVSDIELSIYSGIDKSIEKYLDRDLFYDFYDEFITNTEKNKFDKEFIKTATALTFLKLEIMRTSGLEKFGYGEINNNEEIIIKNNVGTLLDRLSNYSKLSQLKNYNEVQYKVENYVSKWRATVYKYHKRKHLFYKKPFETISKLDEDYKDTSILNDGAFGLEDYNTNWHISSIDNLVLKIDKKEIENSTKITFSFLQDAKHSIYYPISIEILDTDYKLISSHNIKTNNIKLATKEVTILLPTEFDDEQLTDTFIIKINKQIVEGKNTLACDEIIFN